MTRPNDNADRLRPPDDETPGPGHLGPDASAREIARAARTAFFGREFLQSAPSLWLFGQRARARRDRNRHVAASARQRRAQFQQAFEAPRDTAPASSGRTRPFDRRHHRIAVASLVVFAAGAVVAALRFSSPDSDPIAPPAPPAAGNTSPTPMPNPPGPATASGTSPLPLQPPAPSGGVAPISARPPTHDHDPVLVIDPPAVDPTPSELATPDGAVRAWLARLCPFDYRHGFGSAELRARPAMTDPGWRSIDPARNPSVRGSWDRTVAARESAQCAAPTALISPEAPRSSTMAIVIGAVTRVITSDSEPPYREQLTEVRIVRLSADGLWRVDVPTEGG